MRRESDRVGATESGDTVPSRVRTPYGSRRGARVHAGAQGRALCGTVAAHWELVIVRVSVPAHPAIDCRRCRRALRMMPAPARAPLPMLPTRREWIASAAQLTLDRAMTPPPPSAKGRRGRDAGASA